MKTQKLMTEQQFIAYFKRHGFALYQIKGIEAVYRKLAKKEKTLTLKMNPAFNKQMDNIKKEVAKLHKIKICTVS